jgi:hypothetical protein
MQLESSLFAVCVVQLKPQLEKLLKIPYDSLTKEIRMTQDLLELFIKYQIPSDLLSYDGDAKSSTSVKIETVKGYIKTMYEMINSAKQKELTEVQQEARYAQPLPSPPVFYSVATTASSSSISYSSAPTMPSPSRSYSSGPPMAPMASAPVSRSVQLPPPPKPSPAPLQAPAPAPTPVSKAATPATSPIPSMTSETSSDETEVAAFDYTKIPTELDKKFEALDEDSALRPTIINPGDTWTKRAQKALLAEPSTSTLSTTEQKQEKNKAFDLLDALSRSGALSIEYATLHVVLAATHCFDKSLMDTVVQDNINPIEKVERSSLIVATTIQDKPAVELIKADQKERVATYSPKLLTN